MIACARYNRPVSTQSPHHPRRHGGALCVVWCALLWTAGSTHAATAATIGSGEGTRYVDDGTGSDIGDCTDPANPCATIGYAIDQADAGDSIEIADGDYTESIEIDKSLALLGESETGTIIQAHENPGEADGRVITIDGDFEVEIANVTIRHGVADSCSEIFNPDFTCGGGLFNRDAHVTLTNVAFTKNEANGAGGMYNENSSPSLTGVAFNENVTDIASGGGMSNYFGSSPTLRDVTFNGNTAAHSGGGMYNQQCLFNQQSGSPTLTNVTFTGNSAGFLGGGMQNNVNCSPSLVDVIFSENSAGQGAGGMGNDLNSSPTLTNVTFSRNTGINAGGGMASSNNSTPILTNVTFIRNESGPFGGGGMFEIAGASSTLTNVMFFGNTTSGPGGGIFISGTSPTFTNVTFGGNTAVGYGGGMGTFCCTVTLFNTIFWGNSSGGEGNEIANASSGASTILHYSLYSNGPGDIVKGGGFVAENSLTDDPLFVDAENGNLRLLEGSAAIDTGDPDTDLGIFPTDENGNPIDLDGGLRVVNDAVDIGAYEYRTLVISPSPLDFGAVLIDDTRGPLSLTLANARSTAVTIDGISDPEPPFTLLGGTCAPVPFTLAPEESCTLDFSFSPTSAGLAETTMIVTSGGPDSPHTVTLQGIGSEQSLHIAPDPLDFGGVVASETGGPQSVTLTNADASMAIEISTVSAPAAPFTASGGTCGETPFSLAPFATCTLAYTFTPMGVGSFSDVVEVTSIDSGGPVTFILQGEGLLRELTVDPELLDFGDVVVGETGGPLSVSVTNTGDVNVFVLDASAPGAPFTPLENTCDSATLPPEGSCILSYTFSPIAPGEAFATVTLTSEVPPLTVTVQGTGLGAVIDVDPNSLTSALQSGDIETQPLTIANMGNDTLEWEVTEDGGLAGRAAGAAADMPASPNRQTTASARRVIGSDRGAATDSSRATAMDLASELDGPLPSLRPVNPAGGLVDCDAEPGIIIHDDGTVENGYSGDPAVISEVRFVDLFTPSAYPASFSSVCVAFITLGQPSLNFDLVVFDDDGSGGSPGTELGSLSALADGIPSAPGTPVWFSYDISSLGLSIDSGSVYIGARWAPPSAPDVFIAADQTDGNPPGFARGYWWNDAAGAWTPIEDPINGFPDYRSLMVRAVAGEPVDCALPAWASVDPDSGTVPADEGQVVDVTFDATGLAPGDYEATLCISSNDPERPLATVPLALTVTPGPILTFDPKSLDFGDVAVSDTSLPQTATLQNVGGGDATGLTFGPTGGGFEADTSACGDTLSAGASCPVSVTLTPIEPGPASATLEVTSDQDASAVLSLAGTGVSDGVITPVGLVVDPEALLSDGNQVFEPGELIEVAPAWRNDGLLDESLTGTASSFNGSDAANYLLPLEDADYGNVEPGATASCQDTGICYWMGVNDPPVRPATHWQAAFDETLSDGTAHTWSLHIGDSFTDVPRSSPFYTAVETLLHHGVTGGCGEAQYCPAGTNTRGQMAVFLLRAAEDEGYMPPACTEDGERFADVPFDHPLCPWIEELAERGVTAGCGSGNYCPGDPVSRAQMAVFLLKAFEGDGYTPQECTGMFSDVDCPSTFADWVEDLAGRGITGGCSADPPAYCPGDPVSRAQMAVFITRAFGFTLYGP